MYILMINKKIIADSIESEKEAMDKAFDLSKNGQKVEVVKKLGEVVYEPHFKKVTPKKTTKESKEVSKDSVSTEEVKIIMPKNEPSRVSNIPETSLLSVKSPSFTISNEAFLDNIPTLDSTSEMRKSLEVLFAKGFNEAQEPKSFISDNEIDARISLADAPVDSLAYKVNELLVEKESKEVLGKNETVKEIFSLPTIESTKDIHDAQEEFRKELSEIKEFIEKKRVKKQDPVENIIHADIASKTDDIQKVVTVAIDKDSIKVIDVENIIPEPINNPEIAINEVSLSDNDLKEFVEKQIDLIEQHNQEENILNSFESEEQLIKEVLNTEVENVETSNTEIELHKLTPVEIKALPETKPNELTPLELAISEVKVPDETLKIEEVKALPETKLKEYKTSVGTSINEHALKASCRIKLKNALELSNTSKMLVETIKKINETYPGVINETWFDVMVSVQVEKLPENEKALYEKSKSGNTEEIKEIKETGEELFKEFEAEINASQKEQEVFSLANLAKYQSLVSLDKTKLDLIIDARIHEIMVRDLVENIKTCVDPEQVLKGYSKETLSDGRVKYALEARKKADIENLNKLNQDSKKETSADIAIQEIKDSTFENFAAITNKYRDLYLVNNDYYQAVQQKEKEFNREDFNALLEKIKDKSDMEVLRLTSQIQYSYLRSVLKEEWDKHITPITHRVQVKELCDELIKTPLTKQKDLLNKYPKEVQEDSNVLETLSNIRTAF